MALGWLLGGQAHAGTDSTREAMDRLAEILRLRVDDGELSPQDLAPALLVSAQVRYEASEGWFPTRAVELAQGLLGSGGALRVCEACMTPRTWVEDGQLVVQTGPIGLDEVARLDAAARGSAQPARTAIWLDEHRDGVAVRIVDLRTGGVLFAQNVDPGLRERRRSARQYTLAEEYERRARGDGLTQAFVDFALFPGQHIALDWTDQWGRTNANLSGLSVTILDPVLGIGACHYRRIGLFNALVGGKVVVSLPTALVRSFGEGGDVLDPMLTGVGVVRVPFGRSNYGGVLTVSTNGAVGVGISLMNISLLPVIP